MIGHYWGYLGINLDILKNQKLTSAQEWKAQKLKHRFEDTCFSFTSSEPHFEKDNLLLCIMGRVTRDLEHQQMISQLSINEVIIEAFQANPDTLAQKFDGDFFIIIYDKKEKRLSLFNNRYQSTNGYYSQLDASFDNSFLFSSHLIKLRQMRESLGLKARADLGAVKSFISNGFTMSGQTQLAGVQKLLPCYRCNVSLKKAAILAHHTEDEFDFERTPFSHLEQKLDEYESLYQRGIKDYLEANPTNELGSLLSGGHDTSFAFIQGSKVFTKPLHGFTVTFPNWPWDEESYARNICEKNGGIFHPVPFTAQDLDLVLSMVRGNQEPVVGSSLPLHKLSQSASGIVDTMLGGDGGDTLWAEYYPVAEYHNLVKNLPRSLRVAAHKLAKALVGLSDWERFWELSHVAELFTRENYYEGFLRQLCTYRHFGQEIQDRLFSQDLREAPLATIENEIKFTKENFSNALIEGKLFNAFYTYQSFSTYRSIEHFGTRFYLPTINRDLMRFITRLPEEWVNGGSMFHRLTNNKTINRRFHKVALSRHMKKEEIYNRSFDIPWYNILKPRKEVLSLLLKKLKNRGWYNEEFLDQMFLEFQGQKVKDYELLELKHHGYRIFTLLSLEIWATEYIDGRMSCDFDRHINLEDYLAH